MRSLRKVKDTSSEVLGVWLGCGLSTPAKAGIRHADRVMGIKSGWLEYVSTLRVKRELETEMEEDILDS